MVTSGLQKNIGHGANMKHWTELNELETTLIELELLKSNLRLISNAVECSNHTDIQQAIESITCSFENKIEEALAKFQTLWDANAKETAYTEPSFCALDLDCIVRNWGN